VITADGTPVRFTASRDGLTVYDLPTAFYLSDGKLCARWLHRGWASCEARPAMEPAPDTDQAEYVRRFAEYVGLYALVSCCGVMCRVMTWCSVLCRVVKPR